VHVTFVGTWEFYSGRLRLAFASNTVFIGDTHRSGYRIYAQQVLSSFPYAHGPTRSSRIAVREPEMGSKVCSFESKYKIHRSIHIPVVLRNITFTPMSCYTSFIDLQDKLHQIPGRGEASSPSEHRPRHPHPSTLIRSPYTHQHRFCASRSGNSAHRCRAHANL
jgi:hypothetical protein